MSHEHLKPFGHIPGNHHLRCISCMAIAPAMDKRSSRCVECAQKRHDKANQCVPRKLHPGELHLMQLIIKGRKSDGWTPVSDQVLPLAKKIPQELVEIKNNFIRLTEKGQQVLDAKAYLL